MKNIEFAVLRYVHDIAGGEFVNVGVALWDAEAGQLHFRLNDRYSRISNFFNDFDGPSYRDLIRSVRAGFRDASKRVRERELFDQVPEDLFDVVHRVVPEDSSCFQWSHAMSGLAPDAGERLSQLYSELVTYHEYQETRDRRDEEAIWSSIYRHVLDAELGHKVRTNFEIEAENFSYQFKMGWRNGKTQVLEPISFDLLQAKNIIDKANTWGGRLYSLQRENDFSFTAVFVQPKRKSEMGAFNDAYAILKEAPTVRELLPEDEFDDYLDVIAHEADSGPGFEVD